MCKTVLFPPETATRKDRLEREESQLCVTALRGLRSHLGKEPAGSALRMRMRHWRVSGSLPSAGQRVPGHTSTCKGWFWFDKNQTDGYLCWEKKARALLQPQKIWVGKKEMFNWPDPLISDVQVSYKYSSYHQV